MLILTLILALGLGVALHKLRQHHRGLRGLDHAVRHQQRFLVEEGPAHLNPHWDRLCESINSMTAELNRLQQNRTHQLAQFEATLGSLQEGVLIVDENNRILLANQALQSIFPGARNILDQRLELVLHSREFLDYVEAVRAGQARAQHPLEFAKGNDSVWAEVTGTQVPPLDGQKAQWVLFVLHDITRQRQLESVRKDFVANVSHELRTPLSVIKGYIETLVDGHRDMPLEDRTKFLATIERHTERLNSLLDDLLALSRLESNSPGLSCEPTDLTGLINEIVADYQHRSAAAQHRIDTALEVPISQVHVDPLKITQALENLLDNALKYTPAGSHIKVSAHPADGMVEVCVHDDGPGIPAVDLPHIFERFYRVDKGRSREQGGTGLGLSIVKHIVQLHGGQVRVESAPGQGTAFHFSLPIGR